MQYASVTDRKPAPTKPTGRTVATDEPDNLQSDSTDEPGDLQTHVTDEPGNDAAAGTLFDLDPPMRPYDIHLES